MHWERRRDLEGGKELGIRLPVDTDDGGVDRERYVESHEYRGENFDVYTTGGDEWTREGEFDAGQAAFARAPEILDDSSHSVPDESRR